MASFISCSGMIIQAEKTVWIDMNMGPEDTPRLLESQPPDACFITHYHLDHSIWTRHVKDYSNAAIYIPKAEENYLIDLDFVIENTAGVLGQGDLWRDFVVNSLGYRQLEGYHCHDARTELTQFVPQMVLIETPGHSPGHTSFYFPDEKILFSGDMGLDRFGPWYGWSDGSILDFVESILKLLGLDISLVLTSHGGVLKKDIKAQWKGCLEQLVHRERKIVQQFEAGLSKEQIVADGFFYKHKDKIKEPMRSFLNMWDRAMVTHHEELIQQGGLVRFFPELFSPGVP